MRDIDVNDTPNFQVESIIQKMNIIKKKSSKRNMIANNFKNIEEFEVLSNSPGQPIIEGLQLTEDDYNGKDYVKEQKCTVKDSVIDQYIDDFVDKINIPRKIVTPIYEELLKDNIDISNETKCNDIDHITSTFTMLIFIHLAFHIADNWIFAFLQLKNNDLELFDIYSWFLNNRQDNPIAQVLFNCIRFTFMFPHYLLIVPIKLFHMISDMYKNRKNGFSLTTNIDDKVKKITGIGQVTQLIIYIMFYLGAIMFLKDGLAKLGEILKFFTKPEDLIYNKFIVICYIFAIFMFAVSYAEDIPMPSFMPEMSDLSNGMPSLSGMQNGMTMPNGMPSLSGMQNGMTMPNGMQNGMTMPNGMPSLSGMHVPNGMHGLSGMPVPEMPIKIPEMPIKMPEIPKIQTGGGAATVIADGLLTVVKFILYFIFTIPLCVPIGLLYTIFHITWISLFGKASLFGMLNRGFLISKSVDSYELDPNFICNGFDNKNTFNYNEEFRKSKYKLVYGILNLIITLPLLLGKLPSLLSESMTKFGMHVNSVYPKLLSIIHGGVSFLMISRNI